MAETSPERPAPAGRAELLVGVPAEPDRLAAADAALAVEALLREAFPSFAARAVVVTDDPQGASPPGGLPPPAPGGAPAAVYTGGRLGPDTALPTLLEAALAHDAAACALVEAGPREPGAEWVRLLFGPVVEGGFDLVCPAYRRGRLEGLLATGLAAPLTRALFGARLRQPLGREIALSRRAAEQVLLEQGGRPDSAQAAADLWVITKALAREARVCESFLGVRPPPAGPQPDVAHALARVLRTLFQEMDALAPRWQRVRGSAPVATFGDPGFPDEPATPPAVGPLVSAFAQGWRDLRPLWAMVLPPQTLLGLQRLRTDPPEAFRLGDETWARVVYDFAVAWHHKVMDRGQLLLSMTPLYMGWAAGWASEIFALDPSAADARVDRLGQAFEAEKRYLISRWRWPDRFSP
ncbi:MAG TPA: hypothetical protein VLS93_11105 [Anaeromyxobacteraceae bacterium]|nr:hypothetical protein [Anaeromyxobacteraceae bacterium]